MTKKTPGQVAYEASCAFAERNAWTQTPAFQGWTDWDALPQHSRDLYEAVAHAVLDEHVLHVVRTQLEAKTEWEGAPFWTPEERAARRAHPEATVDDGKTNSEALAARMTVDDALVIAGKLGSELIPIGWALALQRLAAEVHAAKKAAAQPAEQKEEGET